MIFEKQVLGMYKGMMHTRCDDTETVLYFAASDFPELRAEPYSFLHLRGILCRAISIPMKLQRKAALLSLITASAAVTARI